ncbi:MAG: potassium/proton antiporter [Syntrophomonadaceae bacterium]|nr:potassium/proton antiporter [Syntrophomonadaceae bacterium]
MNVAFMVAAILLVCAVSSKVLYRFGVPILILFLTIGMLMGSEGPGGIYFDNAQLAENICNLALLIIIFSGGFDTNWKAARPVALVSGILASLGVFLTAALVGIFAHLTLGFTLLEGMLLGSIISSTDYASVFSILRSQQSDLKDNLAPLLEMESGSNDPAAYMLTVIFLGLLTGESQNVWILLVTQIAVGTLFGVVVGKAAVWLINNINLDIDGLYPIMVIGVALLTYSGAGMLGGNGFLAAYITGIIMGNSRLVKKVSLVRYFDGLSWLMQILLFITLGLLVFPSQLLSVVVAGVLVAVFLIFVARPLVVFLVLSIFKRPFKEQLLVSWVGVRGAASIVFATYPLTAGVPVAEQIFNIVFFVALVSVLLQGTLFLPIARKLDLIEPEGNVFRTFTDYSGEIYAELLEVTIPEGSPLAGKAIMDLDISPEVLIMMIKREGKMITPRGKTILRAGDTLMLAGEHEVLLEIDARARSARDNSLTNPA